MLAATTSSCAARRALGRGPDLGEALGREPLGVPVHGAVADALEGVDVLIDFTSHDAVKAHTLTAIERGVGVMSGPPG